MFSACEAALPVDVAVFAAAVADWRVTAAAQKLKRADGPPRLEFAPNPDILATIAAGPQRPRLVVGFAAETAFDTDALRQKRARKGADWLLANDVSGDVFGGGENAVTFLSEGGAEDWPRMSKRAVGERLAARIAAALA